MITNQEAQARLNKDIENQRTSYAVIVDGNQHRLPVTLRTLKETITIAKCKDIVTKIEVKFQVKVNKIKIQMDIWDYENITVDDYISAMYGDGDIPCLQDKQALYWPEKNCLQIWKNKMPVYENNNGTITKDQDALADCLL